MIIFWCEFPKEVDWVKVKKEIDFKTEIYVTCRNRKEFLNLRKKIKSKYIDVGAWPILSKKDGYWWHHFKYQAPGSSNKHFY